MPREYGEIIASYGTITYPGDNMASDSILCKTGEGSLCGIFVTAAANTPTLTVYDNNAQAAGTTILAQFTPAAATNYSFGNYGLKFKSGLYVLSTGSVGATIAYI